MLKVGFLNSNIDVNRSKWGEPYLWNWNGFRCKWRVLGEQNQTPLLLIHGFGASSEHWRNNADFFANAGFQVYGIDLIGFGDSDQPSPSTKISIDNYFWAKQLSAFLEEVIKATIDNKAILIGNSLGSLVALTSIIINPDLIAGVVTAPLPDPAFMQGFDLKKKDPKWLEEIKNFLLKVFFHLLPIELLIPIITRTPLIKLALQSAYYRSINQDLELLKIVTKPARRPKAPNALRSMCIGMATRPQEFTAPFLLEVISQKKKRPPILMIWGRQDKLVPLFVGKQITKEHPWINLSILEKTGHCPHDESPKEFNDNVLDWFVLNFGGDLQKA